MGKGIGTEPPDIKFPTLTSLDIESKETAGKKATTCQDPFNPDTYKSTQSSDTAGFMALSGIASGDVSGVLAGAAFSYMDY